MTSESQKVILSILFEADKKVSKMTLLKLLFLIRKETDISNLIRFYDFFPYDFGPFSFTVYRDLSELHRLGFISENEKFVWTKEVATAGSPVGLRKNLSARLLPILRNYSSMAQDELLDYVYEKYTWYATRSRLLHKSNADRRPRRSEIYTIGYEGLSIDRFLNYLLSERVEGLIDVRNNPISRKYGFSKKTLARLCEKLDIQYTHFPELGIPSTYRAGLRRDDRVNYPKLWDYYEREVLSRQIKTLNHLAQLVQQRPSALLCFENDPQKCHRHRLAANLSQQTRLKFLHLSS